MEDIKIKIEFVLNSDKSIREKVDTLLELDADNRHLGRGHTRKQRDVAMSNSNKIYRAINIIDKETGSLLLKTKD